MNIGPEEFLKLLSEGKTEEELNQKETIKSIEELLKDKMRKDPPTLQYLVRYCGHSNESGAMHLNTDYAKGFVVCKICGSFYQMGRGNTKHLSNGCLHCEGVEKHKVYSFKGNSRYGFEARNMSIMFDNGGHYVVKNLEKEKYIERVHEYFMYESFCEYMAENK